MPVTIEGRREDPAVFLDVVRDICFAEALARYHRGERANLPADLTPFVLDAAENHRSRETLEDLIEDAIGRGDEPGELDNVPAAHIAKLIGMLDSGGRVPRSFASLPNAGRRELAKSLEGLGWMARKHGANRRRVWSRTLPRR